VRALETTVAMTLADTEHAIRAALATQGFGVLTEIDVSATLEAKLGVERPPLKILGACHPMLANRALDIDPSVALFLPCNVVLDRTEEGGTRVRVVDPLALMDDPRFAALADEATNLLQAAIDDLSVHAAS
jgi:uncharacterized protein (DUF302 family)